MRCATENTEAHTHYAGTASLSVSNCLIVEARLVRHLAGAQFQLVVGQAHRAQERAPARVACEVRKVWVSSATQVSRHRVAVVHAPAIRKPGPCHPDMHRRRRSGTPLSPPNF